MAEKKRDSERSIGAYVGAIVANGILLFVVNKVPSWNLGFITGEYPAVLWAMNLSLLVQIGGSFALIFFHPRLLHHLANVVFNGFSLLALVIVLTVFPISFAAQWGNTVARVVLIVAIVGTSIGAVTHVFKAIGGLVFARGNSDNQE